MKWKFRYKYSLKKHLKDINQRSTSITSFHWNLPLDLPASDLTASKFNPNFSTSPARSLQRVLQFKSGEQIRLVIVFKLGRDPSRPRRTNQNSRSARPRHHQKPLARAALASGSCGAAFIYKARRNAPGFSALNWVHGPRDDRRDSRVRSAAPGFLALRAHTFPRSYLLISAHFRRLRWKESRT